MEGARRGQRKGQRGDDSGQALASPWRESLVKGVGFHSD